MEYFVNRLDELNTLDKEYKRLGSSFVVIYGRRRIGKTELITEFIKKHSESMYFLATKESENQNLLSFRNIVADYTKSELLKTSSASWEQTFKVLVEYKTSEKKIIVFDEFQYIGISNPAFPSIMQKIWELVLKKQNIMLILCGSLITQMQKQVLEHNSPLYGRRTAQIRLKQIEFKHYKDFFNNKLTTSKLIPYYAVTGGVPKYIEIFGKYDDIFKGINESILNNSSFLYEEPYFLLQLEVSDIGNYFSLIKSIAFGNRKLSSIATNLGVVQTSLTKYLKVLIDLDLVEREIPITETKPEKSKSGLYKITDNFIAFWFKFVYPYYSYLERGETNYVLEYIKNNFIESYVSFVYEDICRKKMWELNDKDIFGFRFNKIGSHWGKGYKQTDIVALDTINKNIIIGECKYSETEKGLKVLHELEEKAKRLIELTSSKKFCYIIFSKSGFTIGLKDEAKKRGNVILVEEL